jgi:hypothetical protein
MKAIEGYFLITPDDLHWRLSNITQLPNADYLERTSLIYPVDPKQLPKELAGVEWPPKG